MKYRQLKILTGIMGETMANKNNGSDEKLKASEISKALECVIRNILNRVGTSSLYCIEKSIYFKKKLPNFLNQIKIKPRLSSFYFSVLSRFT